MQYSITELLKTVYSFLTTKVIFSKARLVRRPVYIRGGTKLIEGGEGLTTGRFCRFDLAGERPVLRIGSNCEFGDMTHIVAHQKVEIGDDVLISSKCFISDTSHGLYKDKEKSSPYIKPNARVLYTKPVKIGNRVWIGENVVVLLGVTIGDGCIVGANSVVTRDLPENSIEVGAPANIIKIWDKNQESWIKK